MIGSALEPYHHLVYRELAYVFVLLIIALTPAFLDVGIAAWIAPGAVLAFALVHPRALVLAVPGAIALSFEPLQLGELQLNVLEVLVAGAIVGYAPRALAYSWRNRRDIWERGLLSFESVVPDRFALAIALLTLVAGFIALIWMADPDYVSESLRTFRWTILIPVAYVVIAGPVLAVTTHRHLAVVLFLAGAVVSSAIAVVDGLAGGGIQADSITRLSGIAPHPNALALVLERAAVVGVISALLVRTRISPPWMLASVFVLLVTVLTFSRGAVLGMIVGILLILLLTRAKPLAAFGAGAAALVVVGIGVVAPERTLSFAGGGSGSLRFELWRSSVAMIQDHPVTGVGLDQFLYQYLPRYVSPEAWPERFTSHPHNVLLDVWLSLGIIGVLIAALFAVLWISRVRTALRVNDRIALAAAGGIIAAFVHGLVDQTYFLPELAMSFWLLVLLLRSNENVMESDETGQNHPKGQT